MHRLVLPLMLLAGCAGVPDKDSWGGHWPQLDHVGQAALNAAKNPNTWLPLVGAAVLSIDDYDQELSEKLAEQRPLFGSNAKVAANALRNVAVSSYLLTALATPSASLQDKLSGMAVGIVTLVAQDRVVEGIKDVIERERPGGGDRSFPSGHASLASSAATLTQRNLDYIGMPAWARTGASASVRALAIGTGWARVEAGKHHVGDVLAGYAIGHFFAAFMHEAFIESRLPGAELSFHPVESGGALRLTLPLR